MVKSSLCDYCDAYLHVKGTITISNTRTAANSNNKQKLCTIYWFYKQNKQYTYR